MEATQPGQLRRAAQRAQEYFLLTQRSAEAVALTASERTLLRGHFSAAERRVEAAAALFDRGLNYDALMSYREACLRLVHGYLCLRRAARQGEELPETIARAGELLREEPTENWAALARALPELHALDWHAVDALPVAEAKQRCQELAAFVEALLARVEPLPAKRLKALRNFRFAVAALALLAVPWSVELWRISPRNLAYGKHVFASSVAESSSLREVVDDDTFGPPRFQSQSEVSPWLAIDLGRMAMISDAQVFLRNDCCTDSSIPLVFEISEDGQQYRTIATKTDAFAPFRPWLVKTITSRARFVRVRSTNPGVLFLTEVMVFGHWLR